MNIHGDDFVGIKNEESETDIKRVVMVGNIKSIALFGKS